MSDKEYARYMEARKQPCAANNVREDLRFIPSFADWVKAIRPEPWMGRAQPLERTVVSIAAGASHG